jgi:threonine dehydrogenase-like Zn-dependent dehydrogenase
LKAALYNGPHSIEVGDRPDPVIKEPSDAIVRVVLSCVCGSDLWAMTPSPRPSPRDRGEGDYTAYAAMDERRAIKALVRVSGR